MIIAFFICFSQKFSVLRGTEISVVRPQYRISVPLSTENFCEKQMKQAHTANMVILKMIGLQPFEKIDKVSNCSVQYLVFCLINGMDTINS